MGPNKVQFESVTGQDSAAGPQSVGDTVQLVCSLYGYMITAITVCGHSDFFRAPTYYVLACGSLHWQCFRIVRE